MSNILRTIRQDEASWWVNLLFEQGPHHGDGVPCYPPEFPLPFELRENVWKGFLYVVYKSEVVGYGGIAKVIPHGGASVGTGENWVHYGDLVVLAEPLKRMPFHLSCRGFTGIRYTQKNLHELDFTSAGEEVRTLSLSLT